MANVSLTICIVTRDGLHHWSHRRDVKTSSDLEAVIQEAWRDYPDGTVQHKVLIYGTRTPIVLYPNRGSNELQALYRELKS